MSIKNLGWIALGGFAVGFVAFGGAYAAGGKDIWNWDHMQRWGGGFPFNSVFQNSCGSHDVAVDSPSERRWAWNGGDKVVVALSAKIHYRVGEGEELIVRGAPEIVSQIVIKNSEIKLDCNSFGTSGDIDITLPGRAFSNIVVAGSGSIVGENLNQTRLQLNIAGSGSVRAQGNVERVEVNIAGSGDAKLGEVTMKNLKINIAGSGDAEAAPSESAEVNMFGSGNLKLLSQPDRIETHIMGSGHIIHAGKDSKI